MGLSDEKYAPLNHVSEMSEGGHSRNLILGIDCCKIATLTMYL